jgi:hypothetical protein
MYVMHCRAMDDTLAGCVIGLFKTEVINQISSWKSMHQVEWETLKWPYGDASIAHRLIVDLYNNRRLLGPIGFIPRRSNGDVLCKLEHTRYCLMVVEQIPLR